MLCCVSLPQIWRLWAWRWSRRAAASPCGLESGPGSGRPSSRPGTGSRGTARSSPEQNTNKQNPVNVLREQKKRRGCNFFSGIQLSSKCLRKTHLYFDQPVDQDRPHLRVEAGLLGHVVTEDELFLKRQWKQLFNNCIVGRAIPNPVNVV